MRLRPRLLARSPSQAWFCSAGPGGPVLGGWAGRRLGRGGPGKGWGLPLPLVPGLTLHLGHQPHGDGPARASLTATGVESGPLFWVPVSLMLDDVRLVLRSLPFVSFLWRKACSRPSPFATRLVAAVAAPGSGLWRLLPDSDTAPPRPARASAFHQQRPLGRSFNLEDLTCSFLSLPVLSVPCAGTPPHRTSQRFPSDFAQGPVASLFRVGLWSARS